jgi:hypothetical protein
LQECCSFANMAEKAAEYDVYYLPLELEEIGNEK